VNRAYVALLTLFAIVAVGFGIAVMLARMTPASQERTWWRGVLDTVFARNGGASARDEEDRPPIVVRSGSIYFDGGDKLSPSPKWRGWTLVSSSSGSSIWKPDHPAGAAVRAFEVIAVNAIGTSTCPLTPFLADRVDLVYAGSTKPQTASIHTMADKNNKTEPVVETTLRLSAVPGNDTAPDQLAYTTDGVLTGFGAAYQGHGVATCTFNAQGGAYMRVSPVK
jgi:hypothetical protein